MNFGDLNVSRETIELLRAYEQALVKWNPAINLVSKSTLSDIWSRHIVDSAQCFQYIGDTTDWADLGTGAGLPGLVVSILAKEFHPDLVTSLVESDIRKSAFLRSVSADFGLKTKIYSSRIEELTPLNAKNLSARALAPLDQLLTMAERHLAENGICLFLKGINAEKELEEARKGWNFALSSYQSVTNPQSSILKIWNINRVK